jgi:CheY-like chemotaxis protein
LIKQILDFSRHSALERQPLDLVPLLKEHVKLLERTLPENIQVALTVKADGRGRTSCMVNADPTSIQQVIMNLAVNARDAMPGGGKLAIGLECIQVAPDVAPPLPELKAGSWLKLTVSDTGSGIAPDILPYIFDPFFTTKAPGKGTGLGLSQVYGIVTHHDGVVDVQSQLANDDHPGHTTFTLYLPALVDAASASLPTEPAAVVRGNRETLLVVEDNGAMRQALVDSLEALNYRVLEAGDGLEALQIVEQYRAFAPGSGYDIALILSDLVMPEMGGMAFLRALRQRGIGIGVVLLTGHTQEDPLENPEEQEAAAAPVDWLVKPPSLARLAQVVARALTSETGGLPAYVA